MLTNLHRTRVEVKFFVHANGQPLAQDKGEMSFRCSIVEPDIDSDSSVDTLEDPPANDFDERPSVGVLEVDMKSNGKVQDRNEFCKILVQLAKTKLNTWQQIVIDDDYSGDVLWDITREGSVHDSEGGREIWIQLEGNPPVVEVHIYDITRVSVDPNYDWGMEWYDDLYESREDGPHREEGDEHEQREEA